MCAVCIGHEYAVSWCSRRRRSPPRRHCLGLSPLPRCFPAYGGAVHTGRDTPAARGQGSPPPLRKPWTPRPAGQSVSLHCRHSSVGLRLMRCRYCSWMKKPPGWTPQLHEVGGVGACPRPARDECPGEPNGVRTASSVPVAGGRPTTTSSSGAESERRSAATHDRPRIADTSRTMGRRPLHVYVHGHRRTAWTKTNVRRKECMNEKWQRRKMQRRETANQISIAAP